MKEGVKSRESGACRTQPGLPDSVSPVTGSGESDLQAKTGRQQGQGNKGAPLYKQLLLAVVFLALFLVSDGSSTASHAWEGAPPLTFR